jgi:hypothetical protein
MNNQYSQLFHRHKQNPILTAADTSIALATGSVSKMLEWLEQQ